ncbi:hypothetical protein [Corynebacterium freneyi]|uniref:Uncharacterized protein n=1 Tax=Corynebacterium freneyi TaxID=134034 RepID=A0ABS4U3X6_9CORY|nr:hypothetical protein [Corynebacterium freneyi]MBP2331364.1 hypothetical protein [Corynebacterium freneyi]QXA52145.1 hypothetical protein I6L56_08495 [Corynebacterium freneyi]WJZ04013.1 hypothetical protein CFREN_00040 [Corynebacterium freneyi]
MSSATGIPGGTGAGLTAEDLVSVIDVLVELLPEYDGVRIVRPWALAAAGAAGGGMIGAVDVHRDLGDVGPRPGGARGGGHPPGDDRLEDRARAQAETIRRLKPLDRGNDAFAVTAVLVHGRLAGTHMSFDRAAAIAGVRDPARRMR